MEIRSHKIHLHEKHAKFTLLLSPDFLSSEAKWPMAANGLGAWDKIFKDLSVSKEVSVRISRGVRHQSFEAPIVHQSLSLKI